MTLGIITGQATWADDAPATWRFIYGPGPMAVLDRYYHDGHSNAYADRFGGMRITPGWIYVVSYDTDLSGYYDPPLGRVMNRIHERWLKPCGAEGPV